MRRNQRTGLTPLAAGVVTLVLVVVIVYFGFTKAIPFQHHFTIKAAFSSANNIKKNSPVRIAGVAVGKVAGVHFLHSGEPAAVVDLRIDNTGLPIHKDATLAIRPRIFLEGNFFVDLHPGSPSAPTLGDGDTIPVNQTSDPVQLDQVLSALPTATRSDLQRLLKELSTGFSGVGGASLNQTVPYMKPAYQSTSIVNDALQGQFQHDLSNYVRGAGLVAKATDANPAQLQSLITDFNTTAAALAAKDVDLAAAIKELPNTLRAAQPALASLNNSFGPLRGLIADLRPAVRSSLPAINATLPLVRQLRLLVRPAELEGLVRDLRPTVPALAQLNIATPPLLSEVRAASSCQNVVVQPWAHDSLRDPTFPATGPTYQEAVKFLPGLAGESRSGDANGQWFRTLSLAPSVLAPLPGTNLFQFSANPIQGGNPPKPNVRPALRPDVPCETQKPPNLDTVASGPPAGQRSIAQPNTPQFQQRYAQAQSAAVGWVSNLLRKQKLTDVLRVSNNPITKSVIPSLRAAGRSHP